MGLFDFLKSGSQNKTTSSSSFDPFNDAPYDIDNEIDSFKRTEKTEYLKENDSDFNEEFGED